MIRNDSWNVQLAMKEGRRFYKMLMHYVPRTSHSFPTRARILNVGCGPCLEGYAITDYFEKEPYGVRSKNAEFIGIDLNLGDLKTAKEINRNSEFIRMDARIMDNLNLKFDVVITRHPNVCHDTDNWEKIYEKILFLLNPDGILIVTNYNRREYKESLKIIEDLGYKVKVNEENPFYGVTLSHGINYDDWIIIAEKA